MSTVPHDASSRTDSAPVVTTQFTEQSLDAVVREYETVADEVGASRPTAAELRELCRQIADISRDVFGGEVRITVGRDWEVPDWIYFVVDVRASEDTDEFLARVREWDAVIYRNVGNHTHLFCLSFGAEIHRKIQYCLYQSRQGDAVRAANRLSTLRNQRNTADYDLESGGFKTVPSVSRMVRAAPEIVDAIQQCRSEPAFSETRDKIRAYARDVLRITVREE